MTTILRNKSSQTITNQKYELTLKNKEHYTKLRGPRQSCEDIVCSECGKVVGTNGKADFSNYKTCKINCMRENSEKIQNCCLQSCPVGNKECMEACVELSFN